jgi:hypothetical protein
MDDKVNQFNNWVDQWDKALADGVFKDIPKEELKVDTEEPSTSSFFGNLNINTNSRPSEEDVSYWNDLSNYSEDTILNEAKKAKKTEKVEQPKIADLVKKSANNANPVIMDTVGKDTEKNPAKKGFASNKAIEELSELKKKLHSLENEILTKETLGKDFKNLEKEMKKIYSLIDKVSDKLNQGRFETDSNSEEE